MRSLPALLRAVALIVCGTAGVQQARAMAACGDGAQSCLESAGQGWMSWAGIVAVVAFAALMAIGIVRAVCEAGASAPTGPRSLGRTWALATGGLLATCAAQDRLAGLLNPDAVPLSGGWPVLVVLCAGLGLLLALLLRAGRQAAQLLLSFAPALRRPRAAAHLAARWSTASTPRIACSPLAGAAAGRAPPVTS